MKKFTIICMFPAFNYETNLYSKKILHDYTYIKSNTINSIDNSIELYIIGSFITHDDYLFIKKLKNKIKILWLSEPIIHHFKYPFELIKEDEFTYIYGCVLDNINNNRFKLPLYINYYKGWENNYYSEEYFNNLDKINKINNIQELINKKFCTLIARHDNWNTRKDIYNKLLKINNIICPSQLFNNYDNNNFNKIGKTDFMKDFIFNLCPENSKYNFPGYVTEKIMDCCISGCIPIYCGKLDNIDKNIFNIKRILFYESDNELSLNNCFKKVKQLYENKEELLIFYNQDIFMNKASFEINKMINNFKRLLNTIK